MIVEGRRALKIEGELSCTGFQNQGSKDVVTGNCAAKETREEFYSLPGEFSEMHAMKKQAQCILCMP